MNSEIILKQIIKTGNETYPIIDESFYDGYVEECLANKDTQSFVVNQEHLRLHSEDWHFLYVMSFFKSQLSVHEALSVIFRWIAVAINYTDIETNPYTESFHDDRNTGFIINSSLCSDDLFYMRNLKTMDSMLISLVRCGMEKQAIMIIELDNQIHDEFLRIENIETNRIQKPIEKSKEYLRYVQYFASRFPPEFNRELNYWRA